MVLGMHRSGTSLLTGLLESSGLYIGEKEELLPPKPDNPEGFWERRDVMELNEWLLNTAAPGEHVFQNWTGWLQGRPLNMDMLAKPVQVTFKARAKRILNKMLIPGKPWVIKDPRLCLTLSCWKESIGPFLPIILHRHPHEIAKSLHKREGFPLEFSVALWETYFLGALNATLGMPRLFLTMSELREDPKATLKKTRSFLENHGVGPLLPIETIPFDKMFNPALVHHKASNETISENKFSAQVDLDTLLKTRKLPEEMIPVPEQTYEHIAAYLDQLDAKAEKNQQIDHLSAALREAEDTLQFKHQLIEQYNALARKALSQNSVDKAHLEEQLEHLSKCVSHRSETPLRIAVILRAEDPVWLSAALTAYPVDSFPFILVTFQNPVHKHELERKLLSFRPDPKSAGLLFLEQNTPDEALSHKEVEALTPFAPDWILCHDVNEFLCPPPRFATLEAWLTEMDKLYMPRVGFYELAYQPCREYSEHHPQTFRNSIRWYQSLGSTPVPGKAWRCVDAAMQPDTKGIPEHLRRYNAKISPGFLKRYLFLWSGQASSGAAGLPKQSPELLSCTDLCYDDGHPENLFESIFTPQPASGPCRHQHKNP
jgi:hypothetical protein